MDISRLIGNDPANFSGTDNTSINININLRTAANNIVAPYSKDLSSLGQGATSQLMWALNSPEAELLRDVATNRPLHGFLGQSTEDAAANALAHILLAQNGGALSGSNTLRSADLQQRLTDALDKAEEQKQADDKKRLETQAQGSQPADNNRKAVLDAIKAKIKSLAQSLQGSKDPNTISAILEELGLLLGQLFNLASSGGGGGSGSSGDGDGGMNGNGNGNGNSNGGATSSGDGSVSISLSGAGTDAKADADSSTSSDDTTGSSTGDSSSGDSDHDVQKMIDELTRVISSGEKKLQIIEELEDADSPKSIELNRNLANLDFSTNSA